MKKFCNFILYMFNIFIFNSKKNKAEPKMKIQLYKNARYFKILSAKQEAMEIKPNYYCSI